jgi:uncharacterized protein YkvS
LVGTLTDDTQVTLNWTDNSTNEDGFKIERKEENGNYSQIATVNTNITNFVDSGLQLSTTYSYRVLAFNNVGNSITYSNEVSITTTDANPTSNLIYAIKSDFAGAVTTKLVSVESENGNETTLVDFQTTDNCESTSINIASNQIFFVTSLGDGNTDTEIYTADLSNNTFTTVNLNSDSEIDYELVPTNNGTLYAIKQSYISNTVTSKLVSINPANGNESLLVDLNTTDNFNSLAFDSQSNKIYGVTSLGDGNTLAEIYTIDLTNNSYSFQTLSDQFRYELAILDDGALYAFEYDSVFNNSSKLYSLNPTNGAKSLLIDLQTTDNFTNLIVKENTLYGVTSLGDGNSDSEIYTMNIQNNSFSASFLNDLSGIEFELINN